MNNLSVDPGERQEFETICACAGVGRVRDGSGYAGASAVQTYMTNSHLTEVEILEVRVSVCLARFMLSWVSGGACRWTCDDGVDRWLRFLGPQTQRLLLAWIAGSPVQTVKTVLQRGGAKWNV